MVLCVQAGIGESSLHGRGLFAHEDIPAGSVIWRYDPVFDLTVSEDMIRTLPLPSQTQMIRYCYHCKDTGFYIISSDDSRFMKHSDTPNTCEDFGEGAHGTTIALRDIEAGEEITTNYCDYDMDAYKKLNRQPPNPEG